MHFDRGGLVAQKRITLDNGRLLQVGALVYRPVAQDRFYPLKSPSTGYEILLITSRGSGRWILPKGWPMPGRTLAAAALREAYEEAGIRGLSHEQPCGSYSYDKKDMPVGENNRFQVAVFAVFYQRQKKRWPEKQQRAFEWLAPAEAAERVEEAGLKEILLHFTPPPSSISSP